MDFQRAMTKSHGKLNSAWDDITTEVHGNKHPANRHFDSLYHSQRLVHIRSSIARHWRFVNHPSSNGVLSIIHPLLSNRLDTQSPPRPRMPRYRSNGPRRTSVAPLTSPPLTGYHLKHFTLLFLLSSKWIN